MPNRMFAFLAFLLLSPWAGQAKAQSVFGLKKTEATAAIPLQNVAPAHRDAVRQIVEKPTLTARGQPETFNPADIDAYRYFLDHPDRAVVAWRRLGAKCVTIQARGNQQFSWIDENGSEVVWQTVLAQPDLRVWYAEGKVKPGPLLPTVPVKVVVALRSSETVAANGQTSLKLQTEMMIHTDSKTALVVTKMLGPSAQRMAEQGLTQFQYFFGGLSHFAQRFPEQADALTRDDR